MKFVFSPRGLEDPWDWTIVFFTFDRISIPEFSKNIFIFTPICIICFYVSADLKLRNFYPYYIPRIHENSENPGNPGKKNNRLNVGDRGIMWHSTFLSPPTTSWSTPRTWELSERWYQMARVGILVLISRDTRYRWHHPVPIRTIWYQRPDASQMLRTPLITALVRAATHAPQGQQVFLCDATTSVRHPAMCCAWERCDCIHLRQ